MDLTLCYFSANLIPESTQAKIIEDLLDSTKRQYPIVSVTQKPMDLGLNIIWSVLESSPYNYYKQLLECALNARTAFLAVCEDDTLYPTDHFSFRPSEGFDFAYNTNTWLCGARTYWRSPNMNSTGFYIAQREALISLLKHRFSIWETAPALELQRHFHEPGVWEHDLPVQVETFASGIPIIAFEHRGTLSGKRKRFGNPGVEIIPGAEWFDKAEKLYNLFWD